MAEIEKLVPEPDPNSLVFTVTCPNQIEKEGLGIVDCNTQWQITTDEKQYLSESEIKGIKISPTPETDRFWTEFGRKRVDQALDALDKRAEFMLTTIAALIAVNFGLLLAFDLPSLSIHLLLFDIPSVTFRVFPQFFLAASGALFGISYFPKEKSFYVESPSDNRRVYEEWRKHKMDWQKKGYVLFIIGLFAIAITYLIQPGGIQPDVQNINGTLRLTLT